MTRKIESFGSRYIYRKLLKKFNINKSELVCCPLIDHFKLSSKQYPISEKNKEEIKKIHYASIVGSLIYAMVCIRLDIAYEVSIVSWFLSNSKEHWTIVKWIFKYLRDALTIYLYFGNGKPVLDGHTDSDMVNDLDFRKSISRYLMTFFMEKSIMVI